MKSPDLRSIAIRITKARAVLQATEAAYEDGALIDLPDPSEAVLKWRTAQYPCSTRIEHPLA
jgi:hypothetical protein